VEVPDKNPSYEDINMPLVDSDRGDSLIPGKLQALCAMDLWDVINFLNLSESLPMRSH